MSVMLGYMYIVLEKGWYITDHPLWYLPVIMVVLPVIMVVLPSSTRLD